MRLLNHIISYGLFASMMFMSSCSKDELPPNVLAKINDQQITVDDFKRAYLPVLLYSDKKASPATREEILNFLINQTMLAQEARALKLDTIPTLQVLKRIAEKTAFTRILYKQWVKENLTSPSEAELRTAFQRSHTSRLVRHLFTKDEQSATKLYEQLAQGANWDSLAQLNFDDPSLAAAGGVLGWVKFGDMDPAFESALYELEPHQISHPVKTKFGWHIIRVDEESRELMLTEYDFSMERGQLQRIIRERHEQHLSDSVANTLMANANLTFAPEVAPKVWTILQGQVQQLLDTGTMVEISPLELSAFENQLSPLLDEEMLRFDNTVWTVKEFLSYLPEMNRQMMLTDLKQATAYLVRDEIIYREGLKQNLDKRADVQGEIRDRESQFLANLYLRYLTEARPISEQAIEHYYSQHASTKYQAHDSLFIHELIVKDSTLLENTMLALKNGLPPAELAQNSNLISHEELGWFQSARADRPSYYHRLVNLPLHTPVGPLNRGTDKVLIMATSRRRHSKPLRSIRQQVQFDAEDDRLAKLRYNEILRLSPEKTIQIDLEKLHAESWLN